MLFLFSAIWNEVYPIASKSDLGQSYRQSVCMYLLSNVFLNTYTRSNATQGAENKICIRQICFHPGNLLLIGNGLQIRNEHWRRDAGIHVLFYHRGHESLTFALSEGDLSWDPSQESCCFASPTQNKILWRSERKEWISKLQNECVHAKWEDNGAGEKRIPQAKKKAFINDHGAYLNKE